MTICDCDPSGRQMPVSIGRKLQALRDLEFPDLDFEVIPVALTVDQVKATDPNIPKFAEAAVGGVILPDIPAMGQVWGPFGIADRLNWLKAKKRRRNTSSHLRIVARS